MDTHRLKFVGLYDYKTAKAEVSGSNGSTLEETGKWDLEPVSTEYSGMLSSLLRFWQSRINFELSYGYYNHKKHAEADYSSPSSPVFSRKVSSETVTDSMYEAKLFLDGIYRGTKVMISYRDVGEEFKPELRQEPIVFEDVFGDQRGYNIKLKQWYSNFNVNLSWDDIIRKTNSDYYKKTLNYGFGYLGVKGMEISLNLESKKEIYINKVLGINKDEKIDSIIAVFLYSLIYPLTPGVRYPLTPRITFREDKVYNRLIGEKYTTHSLQFDLDYRVETDFGFSISYKTTRYGDPSWESTDAPYEDDYFNGYFSIRF
jgi:hypothetical protein